MNHLHVDKGDLYKILPFVITFLQNIFIITNVDNLNDMMKPDENYLIYLERPEIYQTMNEKIILMNIIPLIHLGSHAGDLQKKQYLNLELDLTVIIWQRSLEKNHKLVPKYLLEFLFVVFYQTISMEIKLH
jgi:hypothetical protein